MQLEEDIICLKVKILQDLEHITGVKTLMDLNTQSGTDQRQNYKETSQDQETTIQIITKQNHEQESLVLEQAKEIGFITATRFRSSRRFCIASKPTSSGGRIGEGGDSFGGGRSWGGSRYQNHPSRLRSQ